MRAAAPSRLLVLAVLALAGLGYAGWRLAVPPAITPVPTPPAERFESSRFFPFGRFGLWWGKVPDEVRAYVRDTGTYSNIEPEDYLGAEQCGRCHEKEYKAWSRHSHRFMNAAASTEGVRGDFSGQTRFRYLGGEGRFWREGDHYFMAVERGTVRRVFRVRRTIGSRYFQYYVGVQLQGPEPADDLRYRVDHVLPFGYWLGKRQWVPTVHIRDERTDDHDDPKANPYEDFFFADYDRRCSQCHTTLPMGDWLLRSPYDAGQYTPVPFSLQLSGYLARQGRTALAKQPEAVATPEVERVLKDLVENRLPARILHMGIECEACHNGGRLHAADPEQTPPYFFPASPLLQARLDKDNPHGRTHANVNWICARCHNGGRPRFPGGISTWNSVEYTDAMRGSCYSKLRCIDCHDPHRAIGPAWTRTPEQDDASCLRCHEPYRDSGKRQAHTHHTPGSEGDRCMNCHMPRMHEGLDQLVRTHTIFSPTKAALIEQNGPNACNLCHLDKPIDWTLGYLRAWYGKTYDEGQIAKHYPQRQGPVGHGWLRHPFPASRLVAAATYGLRKRPEELTVMLNILDDPYLLKRQFGQMAVEAVCGRELEEWGYRFTLSPEERKEVLPKVRMALGGRK
jgi:predicted CXXCH cytochrome family protein